jgi:hypothetical protein
LIDLTIDGEALSNSKAAIPDYPNRAIMQPEGEILYESAGSQQNTVNDGLSARPAGLTGKAGAGACDLWRIRNCGMCFPASAFRLA